MSEPKKTEEATSSDAKPTLAALKKMVGEFLLLGDDGAVDVVIATTIANRLDHDAVWLMLTGPSSSGKTELITPLNDLPYLIPISDLTVNTFASGYKMGGGKSASLLLQYQNGILLFKDFTSLLSKSRETRDVILGQMREIYEGKYDKYTGTGEHINWTGKMGAIAAATKSVYYTLAEATEMGQRFIYYAVKQPDRLAAARYAQKNAKRSAELRAMLKEEYKRYITFVLDQVGEGVIEYDPSPEVMDELLRVADFASLARSPVHTDFKSGLVDMEVDKEMPGRIVKQLIALSAAFIAMNEAEGGLQGADRENQITEHQRRVLYRCAYDSIPHMRRTILRLLARYSAVTTAGVAMALDLPTDSVRKYLQQVNAIGLCSRRKAGGQGDKWVMTSDEYRKVVEIVEGTRPLDKELLGKDETDWGDFSDELDEGLDAARAEALDDTFMPETELFEEPPELPDNGYIGD